MNFPDQIKWAGSECQNEIRGGKGLALALQYGTHFVWEYGDLNRHSWVKIIMGNLTPHFISQ